MNSNERNVVDGKVENSSLGRYKADLHVHTVLSPCGDLEMSPGNIVNKAVEENIRILGITDHNSTRNAALTKRLALENGIFVLTGVEITTREEVHCLAFFERDEQLSSFQSYLERHIVKIDNPDGHFGYQPVVDEKENILEMVPYVLSAALDVGIGDIQKEVKKHQGIFIPAHINRAANGIFSQLGFIPESLEYDALGISGGVREGELRSRYKIDKQISLVRNSDAHFLSQLGEYNSWFELEKIEFEEIRMALRRERGRRVLTELE